MSLNKITLIVLALATGVDAACGGNAMVGTTSPKDGGGLGDDTSIGTASSSMLTPVK